MRRLILIFFATFFVMSGIWSYDLRQSTAVTLQIGPYLDATDGVTPETGLGLADDIEISKNGGVFATVSSASLTYDSDGYYRWDATASETSDLGSLVVKSVSSTVHVPVWHEFMVLPSNVWDSLYSTDKLQVDVTQVSGSAEDLPTATNLQTVDDNVDGVKAKTDNLTFTTSNKVDARVDYVGTNAVTTPDDFKADVSNLDAAVSTRSTFDNTSDQVIVATNNDKTGYALTGSYLTETETNALIELATGDIITEIGTLSIPTVNQVVAGIWAEALPGSFNSGEAGYIVGTNLDATVSSRSSHSEGEVWTSGTRTLTDPSSYKATGFSTPSDVTAAKDSILAVSDEFGSGGGASAQAVKEEIWSATFAVDSATYGEMFERIHAWAAGTSVKVGDRYDYYDAAGALLYSATHADATRTVTAP